MKKKHIKNKKLKSQSGTKSAKKSQKPPLNKRTPRV